MVQRLPRDQHDFDTAWHMESLAEEEREDAWRKVAALVSSVKRASRITPANDSVAAARS